MIQQSLQSIIASNEAKDVVEGMNLLRKLIKNILDKGPADMRGMELTVELYVVHFP